MCAPLLGSVISRRCLNRLLSVQRLASTAPQQPLRWRSRTYYAPVLAARPPSQEPFEEENHPKYSPQRFCSVIPGDLVHDGRYCIISKLGWGGGSTVWLAEDQHPFTDSRYVTISFGNRAREENRQAQLDLLQRLAFADPQHSGHALVRQPSDDFEIKTDDGTHLCLVYTPLRMTLHSYSKLFPNEQLPLPLVKAFTYMLLHGLDYLHTSCNIIHTDLKLQNMLLPFENDSVLEKAAERLKDCEHSYKQTVDSRIFQSQDDFGPLESYGIYPIISDFDAAENAGYYAHPIQPAPFRAPEVLLGWGWTNKADIWNFGHIVWALASGDNLFRGVHREDGEYDAAMHLAQMIAVLGPPEADLIRNQTNSYHCWTTDNANEQGERWTDANTLFGGPFFNAHSGEFLQHDIFLPPQALETMITPTDDDKKAEAMLFIDFMRRMLDWDPDERLSAKQLIEHKWFDSCRDEFRGEEDHPDV